MTDRPEFRERLATLLEDYGRAEVLEAIDKSPRTVTGWLSGANVPLISTLVDICLATGVSSDWLLGLSDKRERAA